MIYPLKLKAPVYCFTTTYQKRRLLRSPKITVYVDGPFSLGDEYGRAGEKKLSLDVYKKMKERSKHSTYQYLRYIKK